MPLLLSRPACCISSGRCSTANISAASVNGAATDARFVVDVAVGNADSIGMVLLVVVLTPLPPRVIFAAANNEPGGGGAAAFGGRVVVVVVVVVALCVPDDDDDDDDDADVSS